ncbi:hypothetical protein EIP86_010937 [Pleurotus ostreatoroseus]|nr:hypothetical protein EIP86_010937 [Pleurotus ostreatoroseus]
MPSFSSGINILTIKEVHFKAFIDLIRIFKEIPLMEYTECDRVTWDRKADEVIPAAASYVSKRPHFEPDIIGPDDLHEPYYRMTRCTDNGAAAWIALLLAPNWSARLEYGDLVLMCRMASSIAEDVRERYADIVDSDCFVAGGRAPDFPDELWFEVRAREQRFELHAYVEPLVEGGAIRVRALALYFPAKTIAGLAEWKWEILEELLKPFTTLLSICFIFDAQIISDELIGFRDETIAQKMPTLIQNAELKYVSRQELSYGQLEFQEIQFAEESIHKCGMSGSILWQYSCTDSVEGKLLGRTREIFASILNSG